MNLASQYLVLVKLLRSFFFKWQRNKERKKEKEREKKAKDEKENIQVPDIFNKQYSESKLLLLIQMRWSLFSIILIRSWSVRKLYAWRIVQHKLVVLFTSTCIYCNSKKYQWRQCTCICIVSFLCFFQQKNSKKENIPAGSNTTAKDVDKKKNMTTSSKTVNNNTKLSSGLKEHCVNSTNLKQSGKPEHHTSKR